MSRFSLFEEVASNTRKITRFLSVLCLCLVASLSQSATNAGFGDGSQFFPSNSSEYTFYVDDLNIPWSDLVIKERIGAGIAFG